MKTVLFSTVAMAILFSLQGCGGGNDGTTSNTNAKKAYSGIVIDSPIVGLNYTCGNKSDLTDKEGRFSCEILPVTFQIGDYTLGSLQTIPTDHKVYPQDLLGLQRTNKTDPKLIELVQFLQALDDDRNITQSITISEETRQRFSYESTNNGGNDKKGGKSTPPSPSTKAENSGVILPDPATAMDHLFKTLRPSDYTPANTTDKAPFVGDWVGTGRGWEVRFKQKSGDFTASFFGLDRNEIPFDGEKTIMSLTVEHLNSFKFHVDENGQIQGEGEIVYNLIPNLCGLDALATEVNSMVNMMDKIEYFFTLATKIQYHAISKFREAEFSDSLDFNSWTVDFLQGEVTGGEQAYQTTNSILGLFGKDIGSDLIQQAQKMTEDAKNSENVCRAAAGLATMRGGEKFNSPLSIEELLDSSKFTIAKTLLFDLSNPLGLMLSIPGVTQVQYYYKGLQNGPEKRHYTLSGHIDNHGKMYLQMDNIEGSKDLVIEYMVNYKKETPSFPVWSPFLKEGATIYPANKDVVIYQYTTKKVPMTYTDSKTNQEKTVMVNKRVLTPKQTKITMPRATFKEAGTHRNGVSVWHEYEYEWNAYKIK